MGIAELQDRRIAGRKGILFCGMMLAATVVAAQTQAPAVPKGDALKGKKLFSDIGCYQCHGYAAQGGGAGPRLAPRPIAFEAFSKYVRKPAGEMPPYTAKVVTDQDLADVYAFLASIPQPASVDSIPLLK
jgi:ubiquinol-cytochrome c reductase cytochrome c subunit